MKLSFVFSLLFSFVFSLTAFSQEQSTAQPMENQCRVQAKEIALKSYQTCVTETRSARIEQIRAEYQEKLNDLKKKYEALITELKTTQNQNAPVPTPAEKTDAPQGEEISVPTTIVEPRAEPKASVPEIKPVDKVQEQDLTINEPTVILKPATPQTKVKPMKTKKVIAQKRPQGEKATKGIAKTLPAKQKVVETKPASQIITQAELSKTAPIYESDFEKREITKAPLSEENQITGQREDLNLVEPGVLSNVQSAELQ